jgi:hypothetical protein
LGFVSGGIAAGELRYPPLHDSEAAEAFRVVEQFGLRDWPVKQEILHFVQDDAE